MPLNRLRYLAISILLVNVAAAQELSARVTVNSSRIGTSVNKKVFQTLQTALSTFVNNRKWTKDVFSTSEKIGCNFQLNLAPTDDANVYTASLIVQAARPVFNAAYLAPIINFQDEDVIF